MIRKIFLLSIRHFNRKAKAIFQHENVFPSFSLPKTNKKFVNKSSLPDSIEKDCQKWESALIKDMESKMESRQWLDLNLKCSDVFSYSRSSKLVISTENILKKLTPSQNQDFSQILKVNSSVYFRISNFSSDPSEQFISPGIVVSVFNGGFSVYFNQPIDDSTPFLNKTVQIQLSGTKTNISQIEFLRTRESWHSLPGYDLLLYAYKCKREEQRAHRLVDSLKLIEGEDTESDEERLALSAALNLQRKLVSIHIGGWARTRLLAKYLDILTKKVSGK
uniref:OGG_N domain-containing protein n=1 Tax=Meloidogyne hapla TaxID=6305 RepID=A0A1I8BUB3_MELHA